MRGSSATWPGRVTCPAPCGKSKSFKDNFKVFQLVHRLVDKDIQQKVLAKEAELPEGEEMSLADVVELVEMEMGKTARALVLSSGGLHRLLEHQKSKQSGGKAGGRRSPGPECQKPQERSAGTAG